MMDGTEDNERRVLDDESIESPPDILEEEASTSGVDFFSQAMKALSDPLFFDMEVSTSATSVTHLPSHLAKLFIKFLNDDKRRKKYRLSAKQKSSNQGRFCIWDQNEDVFRELSVDDVEILLKGSSRGIGSLAAQKCFMIPDNEQLAEVDNMRTNEIHQEERDCSLSQSMESSSGLHLILGSRNRILIPSKLSKKKKFLDPCVRLEKLLVCRPCEGNSALCHFCCVGDSDGQLNRLVTCSICKVVVHRKCYGVEEDDLDLECWVCSWCRHKGTKYLRRNVTPSTERPCVFCPKQGGALKSVRRVLRSQNKRSLEFAHLFCSLWMPEVCVENTIIMEPIMNVDGREETRKYLTCNICKVDYGACVRCSNGYCRASFHPICAREAGFKLEVWGKLDRDIIELHVFCSKHSEVQNISSTRYLGLLPGTDAKSSSITNRSSVISLLNKDLKLNIGSSPITNFDTVLDSKLQCLDAWGSLSNDTPKSETGDVIQRIGRGNLEKSSNKDIKQLKSRNSAALKNDNLIPEVHFQTSNSPSSHDHIGASKKNKKSKVKYQSLSHILAAESSHAYAVKEFDNKDPVFGMPLTCFCSSTNLVKTGELVEEIFSDGINKMVNPVGSGDCSWTTSSKDDENSDRTSNYGFSLKNQVGMTGISQQNILVACDRKFEENSFYVHPSINKMLIKMQSLVLADDTSPMEKNSSPVETASSSNVCFNPQNLPRTYPDKVKHMMKARNRAALEFLPNDELEGELIYLQHRLITTAVTRMRLNDALIGKILKKLATEIDSVRIQRWDFVLAKQYRFEIKKAKKQKWKERKYKKAQGEVAVITAGAVSASRLHESAKEGGLLICSHEVRDPEIDAATLSTVDRSPFSRPDDITESATSSLSEAIQRSEDNKQTTDHSTTTGEIHSREVVERMHLSRETIPQRPLLASGEKKSEFRKPAE